MALIWIMQIFLREKLKKISIIFADFSHHSDYQRFSTQIIFHLKCRMFLIYFIIHPFLKLFHKS